MPEEHSGLGGAGEEEVGVEGVPDDLVDRSHVDAVGHQELGGELSGAKMNGIKSDKKRKRPFNWDDVYQSSSEDERQIIKKRVRNLYYSYDGLVL